MTLGKISAWGIGVVLAGLYAYSAIAAAGNLIGMGSILGAALGFSAWALLVAGVAIPAVALVVALLLGRGRGAGLRLLLLAAGLSVTAALQLNILHLMGQ